MKNKKWFVKHINDYYVKKSLIDGFRSRSAYKLMELNNTIDFFNKRITAIDLGSSPGGWSQVLSKYLHVKSTIISIDILDMKEINNVYFIKGDFTTDVIKKKISIKIDNKQIDLILSDMSPNISGIKMVDQMNIINIANHVLNFAINNLSLHGYLVLKLFAGEESNKFIKYLRSIFNFVVLNKPKSSRKNSSEFYVIVSKKKKI